MRYSTSGMILAAMTIGEAMAGPAHAHLHKKVHEKKRDIDWSAIDWNALGIDWTSAYEAGLHKSTSTSTSTSTSSPVATPTEPAVFKAVVASTTTSANAATTTTSSIIDEITDDLTELWNGLVGASNSRTTFGAATAPSGTVGDNYKGNIGNPYGSNCIKVNSASDYDYTMTFKNSQSKAITINVWQKAGFDGLTLSGSGLAPKNTTLTFVLAAGASQVVAFQANTQIAWAEAVSSFTISGAYATTWGEANFVATGSGYDVSAIENPSGSNYDMTITSSEAPDCTSSMTENYWLTATEPIGTSDGSCYIAQSTATLQVVMGGTV